MGESINLPICRSTNQPIKKKKRKQSTDLPIKIKNKIKKQSADQIQLTDLPIRKK